jgi:hypothetical protein
MTTDAFFINRTPALTLWASVVAERLGFDCSAALSLGKALAGLNAQAKGRRLRSYKPAEQISRRGDFGRSSNVRYAIISLQILDIFLTTSTREFWIMKVKASKP